MCCANAACAAARVALASPSSEASSKSFLFNVEISTACWSRVAAPSFPSATSTHPIGASVPRCSARICARQTNFSWNACNWPGMAVGAKRRRTHLLELVPRLLDQGTQLVERMGSIRETWWWRWRRRRHGLEYYSTLPGRGTWFKRCGGHPSGWKLHQSLRSNRGLLGGCHGDSLSWGVVRDNRLVGCCRRAALAQTDDLPLVVRLQVGDLLRVVFSDTFDRPTAFVLIHVVVCCAVDPGAWSSSSVMDRLQCRQLTQDNRGSGPAGPMQVEGASPACVALRPSCLSPDPGSWQTVP